MAVVTNSRSPGVLAAAAVEAAGLHTVEPPFPLDWRSTDEDYERAVRAALEADDVDAVLVIHAPSRRVGDRRTDRSHRSRRGRCDEAGRRRDARSRRRAAASRISGAGIRVPRTGRRRPRADPFVLALAHRRGSRGRRVSGRHRRDGRCPRDRRCHRRRTRRICRRRRSTPCSVATAWRWRRAGSCRSTKRSRWRTRSDTRSPSRRCAVDRVGRHRRASHSISPGPTTSRRAVAMMREHLGDDADHVLVQEMVPPGVDLRIHVVAEGDLGPVVTVGLGGAHAEAIGDESSRLAPVSSASARSMLDETRAGAALGRRHGRARHRRDRAGRATGLGPPGARRARPQPGDPHRRLVLRDRRHRAVSAARVRADRRCVVWSERPQGIWIGRTASTTCR